MNIENRPDFQLDCTVNDLRERPQYKFYNSLKDKHLSGYFNEFRKNHLLNNNIISSDGIILKNKIFYKAESIIETKQQQNQIKNIMIRKRQPYTSQDQKKYCPNIEKNMMNVRNLSTQVKNAKKILFDSNTNFIQPGMSHTTSNGFKTLYNYHQTPKMMVIKNLQINKDLPMFLKRTIKENI